MTDRFESILDECISALQAGVPIEDILAEVPEYAADLRPMLFAATLLADPKPELIPEERKAALKAEYLAQAAQLPPVQPSRSEQLRAAWHVIKRRLTPRAVLSDLATVTITVVLTLAMAALVLGYAAQDTLPGDWLYGVKQISEQSRLLITLDAADKQALRDEFNQKRLAEIEQLISLKRAAVVRFSGTLETKGANLWVIEGLPVFLPNDVVVEGDPQEGDRVAVVGFLRTNNVMVADTLKIGR
jgi:hypothetical protein